MACEGKTYDNVDTATMESIRASLRNMGMQMPDGHEGLVEHSDFGVAAAFMYSEQTLTLYVQVERKPMFIPCSFIYSRLDQAISRRQDAHDPIQDQ